MRCRMCSKFRAHAHDNSHKFSELCHVFIWFFGVYSRPLDESPAGFFVLKNPLSRLRNRGKQNKCEISKVSVGWYIYDILDSACKFV